VAQIRRRGFFALDRHRLGYLNFIDKLNIEKLNCDYCACANALPAYACEIAGRTVGTGSLCRMVTARRTGASSRFCAGDCSRHRGMGQGVRRPRQGIMR
jgi:hypothetical protein